MATAGNHDVYVQPEDRLAWRIAAQEAPVFVDDSGRRARWVRLAGAAMAGLCALWLTGLVIGTAGFANFPSVPSPVRLLPALARVGPTRLTALDRVDGTRVTALARVDVTRAAERRLESRELLSDRDPRLARES